MILTADDCFGPWYGVCISALKVCFKRWIVIPSPLSSGERKVSDCCLFCLYSFHNVSVINCSCFPWLTCLICCGCLCCHFVSSPPFQAAVSGWLTGFSWQQLAKLANLTILLIIKVVFPSVQLTWLLKMIVRKCIAQCLLGFNVTTKNCAFPWQSKAIT